MDSPNLDAALAFLADNPKARLFPAREYKDGQHKALVTWSTESSERPERIRAWAKQHPGCYFCLDAVRSPYTVLDPDDKHGKDGNAVLAALEREHGTLPKTMGSKSPTGSGRHMFFYDETGVKTGANRLGTGLDVPVMVPLPGQDVPGKGRYELTSDGYDCAVLPTWVQEVAGRPTERTERAGEVLDIAEPMDVVAAAEYLREEAPPCHHGERDDNTFKVGAKLRSRYSMPKDMALRLMTAVWADDGWTMGDIDRVLTASVYGGNAKMAQGEEHPRQVFRDLGAAPEQSLYASRTVKAGSLGLTKPKPRKMFLRGAGGLVQGKIGIIAGQGGAGKTRAVTQIAVSAATGVDCTGDAFDVVAKGPVLMVLAEDDQLQVEENIYAIRQNVEQNLGDFPLEFWGCGEGDPRLIIRDKSGNLIPTPGYDLLRQKVAETKPVLLVIDSLSVTCGEAETSNGDGAFTVSLLSELCRAGGDTTVLILAHVNKQSIATKGGSKKRQSPEEKLDQALDPTAVRGPSSLVNNVRWAMTMTLVPRSMNTKLGADCSASLVAYAVRKTNYSAPIDLAFLENVVEGDFVFSRALHARDRLADLVALVADQGPVGKKELRERNENHEDGLRLPRDARRELIQQALDYGLLVEVMDGRKKALKAA